MRKKSEDCLSNHKGKGYGYIYIKTLDDVIGAKILWIRLSVHVFFVVFWLYFFYGGGGGEGRDFLFDKISDFEVFYW